MNGKLIGKEWDSAPFTESFIDIRGSKYPTPYYDTKVKMLWDKEFLYVGAVLQEEHVWTSITEKNQVIYWNNDFEVFVDPDSDGLNYYEFEINALNNIWELSLDKPYNKGGQPTNPDNMDGLQSSVFVDGTINDPKDTDKGWSITIAFPLKGFKKYGGDVPEINDVWRINFSRVQWKHEIIDGVYHRIPRDNPPWNIHKEENWVWSSQDEINMHKPENWGLLQFGE